MKNSLTSPISVVIPTYNGKSLLSRFLPTVFSVMRSNDELIIVDDHSSDASVSWLVQEFKLIENPNQDHIAAFSLHSTDLHLSSKVIHLKLIANNVNERFGAAANRGVENSSNPYILLLNSDVKPLPGLIEALLPHFQDSTVFGVGCLEIENPNSTIPQLGGKNILKYKRGMFIHQRATEFSTGPTAWVSGGSGMFDRAKWIKLGGFHEAYYPAYWEDIDLSFRARKNNWKILFEASAKVEHHHETTNSDVFGQKRIDAMSWKNANVFVWRNGTISQRILHVFWKPYWFLKRRAL